MRQVPLETTFTSVKWSGQGLRRCARQLTDLPSVGSDPGWRLFSFQSWLASAQRRTGLAVGWTLYRDFALCD